MKNSIVFFMVLASMAMMLSCKKENVPLFNADPSVYFLATAQWNRYTAVDSILASFGYSADNVTDSIVRLPVNVLGKTSSLDRVYKVVALDGRSTAKAGYNYDLPATTVIRAGLSTDSLVITIHRTPDILYHPLTLTLQLVPNENFVQDLIKDTLDAITGKPVYYTIFKVVMQDGLTQPRIWNEAVLFFGTFSPKKLRLISAVTGIPLNTLSTGNSYPMWGFWATMTNRYLLDQKAAGTPVLEDDGTPMAMGRFVTT
ncbi:DUF4843 domain-containing protein [Flavitalea flava]